MNRCLALLVLVISCSPATTPAAPIEIHAAAAEFVVPPYARADWSKRWLDADHDCQSTRIEVLIAESTTPVVLDERGCRVVSGTWVDPYTGGTYTNPHELDIDHLVPLANAHAAGGWQWDSAKREAYANDLDDPNTLQAVGASVNRAKGDRAPDEWLPPDPARRCTYVNQWTEVKSRWGLSMTQPETTAILRACSEAPTP